MIPAFQSLHVIRGACFCSTSVACMCAQLKPFLASTRRRKTGSSIEAKMHHEQAPCRWESDNGFGKKTLDFRGLQRTQAPAGLMRAPCTISWAHWLTADWPCGRVAFSLQKHAGPRIEFKRVQTSRTTNLLVMASKMNDLQNRLASQPAEQQPWGRTRSESHFF
jgi:hypothetical protein